MREEDGFEGEDDAISMPDVLQEGWLVEQIQHLTSQAKKDLQAESDEEALNGYDSDGPGTTTRALRGELVEERMSSCVACTVREPALITAVRAVPAHLLESPTSPTDLLRDLLDAFETKPCTRSRASA